MANPYALDFSNLQRLGEFQQQQELLRNRLAMEQERLGFEREKHPLSVAAMQEANRHAGVWNPLQEKKLKSDIAQQDLLDPYDLMKRKAEAEAAKEGLDVTRQYRQEQGFAVPNAAARLPTAGTTGATKTGSVEKPAQALAFLKTYVLNGGDKAESNWNAFVASHPDIYNGLHADGFVANGKPWRENATNLAAELERRFGVGAATPAAKPIDWGPEGNVAPQAAAPAPARPLITASDPRFAQPQAAPATPAPQATAPAPSQPANQPLFPSIGGAMRQTERMAAVPGMASAAEAKFKTLQTMLEKGQMPTLPGSRDQVIPLTGSAETQARAAELKQEQEKVGEARATAKINLPDALNAGSLMVRNINAVLNDPALGNVTGVVRGHPWMPTIWQESADLEPKIKQLLGQSFMQAYNSLRGGGQITEVEGAKATDSIARLGHLRVSTPAYQEALREARTDIIDLMHLAQAKAAGQGPAEAARIGVLREARSVIAENAKSRAPDADKAAALEAIKARLTQNGIDPARL